MTKIFFFDLDGTLRQTKSGATFISFPEDQKPIAGSQKAVAYYQSKGFTCVGITNQGGVAAGHKSLESAIEEQRITLSLFPQLSEIFFCPSWGEDCYKMDRKSEPLFISAHPGFSCRKPGCGMIQIAATFFREDELEIDDCWMTGDRPEDEQCAAAAGINFIPAAVMLAKFTPGMTEIACTHTDPAVLLKFLAL